MKTISFLFYFFKNAGLYNYWADVFNRTFLKKIDTWDYQWLFTRIINNGIGIIPKKNMICNIGFGPGATHTLSEKVFGSKLKTYKMAFPLIHPQNIAINKSFDKKLASKAFFKTPSVYQKLKQKMKSFFIKPYLF